MIALGAYKPPAKAFDRYYANTVLLFTRDGTDESTTLTDESYNASGNMAVFGNCAYDTAQAKFGLSSIRLGTGGFKFEGTVSNSIGVGGANFTVEAWIRPTSLANTNGIAPTIFYAPTPWTFYIDSATYVLKLYSTELRITGDTAINVDEWAHVAWTRESSLNRLFLNGIVQAGTYSNPGTIYTTDYTCRFGAQNADVNGILSGWIDDVRITKGVARYTASFTPPIHPFASSA
jgi:hypothetical protein